MSKEAMVNKKVFGIIGVLSKMAAWNNDFTGQSKQTDTGDIFGSDKALKYAYRNYWYKNNLDVLMYKTLESTSEGISVVSLKERYEALFGEIKDKTTNEMATDVFKCIDVKNFGATVAIAAPKEEKGAKKDKKSEAKGINIAITGAVQFGQGINKYKNTEEIESTILSPFSVNDKKGNNTLGTMSFVDEAHYIYPFSINPLNYKEYTALGYTNGYTSEDYQSFKDTSLVCATELTSVSKAGCSNELAIFIETKNDVTLPFLEQYITFDKNDSGKGMYTLGFDKLLSRFGNDILSVEIYYDELALDIVCDIPTAKYFNIYTKQELTK